MRQLPAALRGLNQRNLVSWAGALLTAACVAFLGYVLYRERDMLIRYVLTADFRQIGAIIAWYLVDLAIYIAAWSSIMARVGVRLGFATHVRIFCAANMAKRLPGTVWYVAGRVALYGRAGLTARSIMAASAIEGALIWLSGVALSIPVLLALIPHQHWGWLGLGGLLLVAILNPWTLRYLLSRITHGTDRASFSWAHVYGWLALYVLGWAVSGLFVFAILAMLQPSPIALLPNVIGSWTVAGTATMLTFFLPSGFGVTEVTLTALLSRVAPAGVAVLTALGVRLMGTFLDIILGGLAYLAGVHAVRR